MLKIAQGKVAKPVYLCILDGFGLGKLKSANAIHLAMERGQAPFLANLFQKHKFARLSSSGRAVGLPLGTMGNSEVNHLNMGAGRVVYQSLLRINKAIQDDSFFKNHALNEAIRNCKENKSTLHLMGILQGHGGTVHGNIKHLFALLELVKKAGLSKVALHLFTDGRDTDPQDAGRVYLGMLEEKIAELGLEKAVKISTVMGREIVMDRDTAWGKTLLALRTLVLGEGERKVKSAREAIKFAYDQKVIVGKGDEAKEVPESDEFIRPTVIGDYKGIRPKDSVIFWNFRQDRGIQLTTAFREIEKEFFNYKKGTKPIHEDTFEKIQALRGKVANIVFVAMTEYYPRLNALTAFPEKVIPATVGEIIAKEGLGQLRLAGTEKFAHVTGWFSGRRLEPFEGEERILIQDPSLKERTNQGKNYDWVPEMTAYRETAEALSKLSLGQYSLIVHNFQNLDMVGHTGNLEATIQAVIHISKCLSELLPSALNNGWIFVLTADHGNADEMLVRRKGKLVPSTKHSTYPVPLWVFGVNVGLKEKGTVPDIGVTVLDLLGLPKPSAMAAESLIRKNNF